MQDMPERDQEVPSAERVLQLKDEISARWAQLPPEHQASMALTMLGQVCAGEYGGWLREAIDVLHAPTVFKLLPITPLSPTHLAQANLTDTEIAQLNDDDLQQITHTMLDHFTNDVFWEELEFIARKTLDEKRQG